MSKSAVAKEKRDFLARVLAHCSLAIPVISERIGGCQLILDTSTEERTVWGLDYLASFFDKELLTLKMRVNQ